MLVIKQINKQKNPVKCQKLALNLSSCKHTVETGRTSGVTYLEVYVKLGVFLQLLVKTLLVVVGQLKRELGAEHGQHMQQQAAQSRPQHGGNARKTARSRRSAQQLRTETPL